MHWVTENKKMEEYKNEKFIKGKYSVRKTELDLYI